MKTGTRWSGAEWADMQRDIMIVGVGGIGSWTALSLARIGHELYLVDPDRVDETNVTGGQMYRKKDVNDSKVNAVYRICQEFGCSSIINCYPEYFSSDIGVLNITITGLDNMKARKEVFEGWKAENASSNPEDRKENLLVDGRLVLEMYEIFAIRGDRPEQIEEYEKKWLFGDEQVAPMDCTAKQTTFAAMGIASNITALVCNHLTNVKMGEEFREVPFYQRQYLPIFDFSKNEVETPIELNL